MNYKFRLKWFRLRWFRLRWYRLAIATTATMLISIGWQNIGKTEIKALDVPDSAAIVAQDTASAIWQQGSFPVENFQSYTSPFGYRISPVDGKRQFHNGLDMAAPRGSYIRSWWTGRVIEVSENTTCGVSIAIESGAWTHTYCHMEGHVENSPKGPYLIDRPGGIQILQGQDIPVGARIGRIGMTGRTTGPHLHWVLKHNGSYVDPALVLKEMFKNQNVS